VTTVGARPVIERMDRAETGPDGLVRVDL